LSSTLPHGANSSDRTRRRNLFGDAGAALARERPQRVDLLLNC
jgi:hypothetical protein